MNKFKYSLILLLALFAGCEQAITKEYVRDQHKTVIASVIAKNNETTPTVVVTKYKRSECPECKGKGVVTSGDGLHTSECNACVPDGSPSPSPDVKPDRRRIFPNIFGDTGGCCEDCNCGAECECAYPGECLIKKNHGWPVTICSNNTCRTYYPRDENGKSYDPYLEGVKSGAINANDRSWWKYKKPLPIDSNGDEIKQTQYQKSTSSCSSCR